MKPLAIYNRLYHAFGPQHWWPVVASHQRQGTGDKRFEICVGAILTQNTAWGNVEKALINLASARALNPAAIVSIKPARLSELIRPAGYFRQKTKKLKIFTDWFFKEYGGDFKRMKCASLPKLRTDLLSVWGIGPETADSMLLYALGKPSFVIDAYTKRLCGSLGIAFKDYHEYQEFFTSNLPKNAKLYNEYHALIVAWGKLWRKDKEMAQNILKNRVRK